MACVTVHELAFPVIEFDRECYVLVYVDADSLTTLNAASLKRRRRLPALTIVDSTGRTAKVTDTKFVTGIGPFWGFTIFLDRIIRVDLTLEESARPMTLEQLKKIVLRDLGRQKHSVLDEDGWEGFMRRARDVSSIPELANLILPYRDPRKFIAQLRRLW